MRSRKKPSLGKISAQGDEKFLAAQKRRRLKTRSETLRKAKELNRTSAWAKRIKEQTYNHDRSVLAFASTYERVSLLQFFYLFIIHFSKLI